MPSPNPDDDAFEAYLKRQVADPAVLSAEARAAWRTSFATAATARRVGRMKLRSKSGEYRYAVSVRHASDLVIALWVRRSPKGDVFVLIPRPDGAWNPHTSYHADGTFHVKSDDQPLMTTTRQPLTESFVGTEHLGVYYVSDGLRVGAIYHPADFTAALELTPDQIGARHGFIAVDVVARGCDPLPLDARIVKHDVFSDVVPWLVIRAGVTEFLGGS